MEPHDLYYTATLVFMLLGGIVTIVVTFQNMKGKIELLSQDVANHKQTHERLQRQVDDHEDNVNLKLEKIDAKIDEVKDMIIEISNRP